MKTKIAIMVVLAVVVALTATQPVSAGGAARPQARYTVADLGTLPGQADSWVWGGVNNRGHVAVYATNDTDPGALAFASSFLWKGPGDVVLLPGMPGTDTTIAFGLNDLDQVVGTSGPTPEGYLAVLWERGHVKALGKLPGDTDSNAYLISSSGLVVGDSENWNANPWTSRAVYWYQGRIFPLPSLVGAVNSAAIAVNDWGQIVGQSKSHAVLWSISPKARVKDLGTLGGDGSWPSAINNWGEIVGQAQTDSGDWHPVLWDGNGITDLQNFGDDLVGSAYGINDRGQTIGFSGMDFSDITTAHALLWENGRVINLQNQIPANSGWVLQQALGINDQGQITGFGMHKGKIRAFLLTPINAPGR